jgi:hypothetical protein
MFKDLFEEEEWKDRLAQILCSLLKQSSQQLSAEVMEAAIEDNIMCHNDNVARFSSRTKKSKDAKGKEVEIKKVPGKPRANALLTKEEQVIFKEITELPFNMPKVSNSKELLAFIRKIGFAAYKSLLQRSLASRVEFLTKFGSMTTKRLQEVVKITTDKKDTKRKRDLKPEEVRAAILRRPDPTEAFTSEVRALAGEKQVEFMNELARAEGNYTKFTIDDLREAYKEKVNNERVRMTILDKEAFKFQDEERKANFKKESEEIKSKELEKKQERALERKRIDLVLMDFNNVVKEDDDFNLVKSQGILLLDEYFASDIMQEYTLSGDMTAAVKYAHGQAQTRHSALEGKKQTAPKAKSTSSKA